MSSNQIKILSKKKKLITNGRRRFQVRKDRDYVQSLLDLGITEKEDWNYILRLNAKYYVPDYKPSYSKTKDSLIFKMEVNKILAYIKLKKITITRK